MVKSTDSHFSFPKAEHYEKDGQEQEAEANHDYNHLHLSIAYSQESISITHILQQLNVPDDFFLKSQCIIKH